MKVAVAQVEARALDVAGNVERTVVAIAEAAAQGATHVVLPEVVTTGWLLDADGLRAAGEPGDGSGPALSAWQAAAREHGVAVIGGFTEVDGERLYNAAVAIDRHGELRGHYRKLHLFGAEKAQFAPGDLGLPVFDLDGVKTGILVCYDLRFPEAIRLLALQGAELVAVPTAWVGGFDAGGPPPPEQSIGQVDGALVLGNLNQVFVACADLVGSIDGVDFLGRSLVVSPYGKPLAGPLPADAPGVGVAELDLADVARARKRAEGISPREDRRTDVYALELANGHRPAVDGAALLAEIERKRGYVLDLHKILAARDPAYLRHYEDFLHASFLQERSLDRRTKELVYIGVLMALGTPPSHLVAHMRAAVAHGATEQEVLEVLEQVLPPAGVPRFITALDAFREVFATAEEGAR